MRLLGNKIAVKILPAVQYGKIALPSNTVDRAGNLSRALVTHVGSSVTEPIKEGSVVHVMAHLGNRDILDGTRIYLMEDVLLVETK